MEGFKKWWNGQGWAFLADFELREHGRSCANLAWSAQEEKVIDLEKDLHAMTNKAQKLELENEVLKRKLGELTEAHKEVNGWYEEEFDKREALEKKLHKTITEKGVHEGTVIFYTDQLTLQNEKLLVAVEELKLLEGSLLTASSMRSQISALLAKIEGEG